MDVILADEGGVPGVEEEEYWRRWKKPHIFHRKEGGEISPPEGWSGETTRVFHADTGGSTDSVWELVTWVPPGGTLATNIPVPQQPWIPLLARVNGRDRTAACPPPTEVRVARAEVLPHDSTPGVVLGDGLFPSSRLSQLVGVRDARSPTGYGCRALGKNEKWDLWDVPITLQERVGGNPAHERAFRDILRSPPAKILMLGGDALLGGCIRAGAPTREGGVGTGRRRPERKTGSTERDFGARRPAKDQRWKRGGNVRS